MKVRRQRRKMAKQEIYTPQAIEEEEDEAQLKEQTKQKKSKYASNQAKDRTRAKAKNQSESFNNDDSQQSEVLQFRHGDDAAREHIRPIFLKRWDGTSNEVQLKKDELDQMSPMMRVYWEVKSKNMNAVVFLEFGRMQFFAFENDAIKLHEMFKKRLKRFSKFIMVNFWYKEIQQVKKTLFHSKVPILIMNQIEDARYRQDYGLIRREVVEVITPALHIDQQDQTPRERLLLSLISREGKFAVIVLDAQSNNCFAQQFDDDEQYHEIRRIFNKYRPVQLIVSKQQKRQIIQIAKQISNPYINQFQIHFHDLQTQLSMFEAVNSSPLFRQLIELYHRQKQQHKIFSKQRLVQALQLLQYYLSTLSLKEKIFNQGMFHSLSEKMSKKQHFFDSQVYQNLQVFRIKSSQEETYAKPGTLMGFLDNCKTKHGRKLLHKWIDQPLASHQAIQQRQKAIQQLFNSSNLLSYHDQFAKYERLEKRLGDIYHWVSRHYQKGKLILTRYINPEKQYDLRKNPAVNKLKELISILQQIKDYERLLKKMTSSQVRSSLLKKNMSLIESENIHTLSMEEIKGLQGIPQIGYIADSILRRIYYDQMTGHIEPRPGENQVFDYEKKEIQRINVDLQRQLDKWKQYFKTEKIVFVSIRAKNEIQIPKMAINKCPPNKQLIFSSQIANCIRYTTHETNILSGEIMEHQRAIAQSYEPFLQELIDHFCSYKYQWNLYIRSMATIDVLMAISKAAQNMPIRSLPQFKEKGGLVVKNGYNVNLIGVKQDLVSNSLKMEENEKVLLLTGPNMGGKSTFLKQICYLAILAQIGSYVPAEYYSSIIFDQIFCRMGASDRIYEGKSTFYVELQQTKRTISKATSSSLVVIDELGRGTSTFDGMAISQSILDHLISTIKCITLYSTHYTQITQQYEKNKLVRLMKMGYEPKQQGIDFTYQLIPGVAQKSFATNVARLVNIPLQIIKRAEARSQIMHQQIVKKKQLRQIFKLCGDLLKKPTQLNESTSCSR